METKDVIENVVKRADQCHSIGEISTLVVSDMNCELAQRRKTMEGQK